MTTIRYKRPQWARWVTVPGLTKEQADNLEAALLEEGYQVERR